MSQRRSRVRSRVSRFLPAPALSGLGFASGQMGTNFPAPPSDPARHHSDPRGAGTSRDAREGRGGKSGGGEGEVRGTQRQKENQPPRDSYLSIPWAPRSSPRSWWPSRCGGAAGPTLIYSSPPYPEPLNFLEADAACKWE